jgi:hypothetical protein
MKQWLLNQLPMKVVTLTLLFSGSTHGWKISKFHELCDDKGPTITVIKSKAGRVFGGFAMQSWDSKTGGFKADEKAFIYSIDRQQIYRVIHAQKALYCRPGCGPSFGWGALGLVEDPLNNENGGCCYTNGFCEAAIYGIKSDAQGNHEVTGEGN